MFISLAPVRTLVIQVRRSMSLLRHSRLALTEFPVAKI